MKYSMPEMFQNTLGWGLGPGAEYPFTWQGRTCIRLHYNKVYANYCKSHGWFGLMEINGNPGSKPIPVKPGDHCIFRALIWTENSTADGGGCYMLVDPYDSSGRICELRGVNGFPSTEPSPPDRIIVPWGSGAFQELRMDFVIQESYITEAWQGSVAKRVPSAIIPVLQALDYSYYEEQRASAYIAEAEVIVGQALEMEYMYCPVCQKQFPDRLTLNGHIRTAHPKGIAGNPLYLYCPQCDAVIITQAEYDAHMASVHAGGGGSPMHLATVCGLYPDEIERLREFGHVILSQDLQDLYHKIGPDVASYLDKHVEAKKMVKAALKSILDGLA